MHMHVHMQRRETHVVINYHKYHATRNLAIHIFLCLRQFARIEEQGARLHTHFAFANALLAHTNTPQHISISHIELLCPQKHFSAHQHQQQINFVGNIVTVGNGSSSVKVTSCEEKVHR